MPRKKSSSTSELVPTEQAEAPDPVGHFEADLKELEGIVQQMEGGDLPLEKTLQLFERGVELSRQCRDSLEKAELRIRELMPDDATDSSSPGRTDSPDEPDQDERDNDSGEIPF